MRFGDAVGLSVPGRGDIVGDAFELAKFVKFAGTVRVTVPDTLLSAPHTNGIGRLNPCLGDKGTIHQEVGGQVKAHNAEPVAVDRLVVICRTVEVIEGDDLSVLTKVFPDGHQFALMAFVSCPGSTTNLTVPVGWSVGHEVVGGQRFLFPVFPSVLGCCWSAHLPIWASIFNRRFPFCLLPAVVRVWGDPTIQMPFR